MDATLRSGHGKGASRRLRATDRVPAVVYGGGTGTLSISVAPKELAKALLGAKRRNQLIELKLKDDAGADKGSRMVLVQDLQAHPVRRNATHVDFLLVDPKKAQPVKVPFEVTGKSKASIAGANTQLVVRTLNVSVAPESIPEKIVLDITECDFGVVRAKLIKMPTGCTLIDDQEMPVVSLRLPRGEKEEAAATPAAGAPAAAAAAPAAGAAAAAKPGDKKDDKKK
jgi:large subunit ribosomal protein L25